MKKRILSILLSLAMVLTLTPVSAFATLGSYTITLTDMVFPENILVEGAKTISSVSLISSQSGATQIKVVNGEPTASTSGEKFNNYTDGYFTPSKTGEEIVINGTTAHYVNSDKGNAPSPTDTPIMIAKDDTGHLYYYAAEFNYDTDATTNTCTLTGATYSESEGKFTNGSWQAAKFYLQIEAAAGGTVTGKVGESSFTPSGTNPHKAYYDYGTQVTLTAVTSDGYEFDGWKLDNDSVVSENQSYTFTVTTDGAYTPVFTKVQAKSGDQKDQRYATVSDALTAVTTSGSVITTTANTLDAVSGGKLASGVTLATPKGKFTAKDAAATIDMNTDGAITLTSGKLEVTGAETSGTTVTAKYTLNSSETTIEITVPAKITATIDLTEVLPVVTKLKRGESVTYGGITYKAAGEDSAFPLNESKLSKNGETATIPTGRTADVAVKVGDGLNITVPSADTGDVTLEQIETGAKVTIAKENDTFTAGGKTYTAASAGAVFTVDTKNNVTIASGSAKIAGNTSIIGGISKKTVTNPKDSGAEITVSAGADKDTVTVSKADASVVITGEAGEEGRDVTDAYTTASDGVVIDLTKASNKLTSGTVKIGSNDEITAGDGNALIRNTCAGIITVQAKTPGDARATVTVPVYGSITIGGKEFANASKLNPMTIVVGENGYEIKDGSVKLENGEAIKVGTSSVGVTNTGEQTITVNKEGGEVTVPQGGMLKIGAATIEDIEQETIFKVADNGQTSVNLAVGDTVTINNVIYTGAEGGEGTSGGTLTINAEGKVSAVTSEIVIAIDEDVMDAGFSYDIVPETSVTAGKYVYTAPAGCTLGDVTIEGRVDEAGAILNPALVLKDANKQVIVTLSTDKNTKTTYTAASANAMFAMNAAGTDTKKIDLLNNSKTETKPGSNSSLKFTNKETYVINGMTYQAQDVKEENNEVKEAVSYTVTFGEAEVETGKKDEDGEPIKETVSRNTVAVDSGSKVKVTMASKGTISIASGYVGEEPFTSPLPFTAMNGNASLIIDNSNNEAPNKISGDDSYLTAIKGEGDTITGYEVRRRSSGGVVAPSGNVTNSTEDKNAGSGAGTSKVETTTAAVTPETKTNTDGTRTTTAAVDKQTATSIVDKAVENKSEEVVINTTTPTNSAVTETAAGSKTEVALPEETVQGLSQKTEAAITIKSDAAEVTLDKEAVQAVAEQAGSTGTVSLVVETVKQDASAVQVDLRLVTSKGNVTDFRGGNVSVTVKLSAALAAKPVVCVYIDGSQLYHKVNGQKNADGTFTFKTNHFSSYAIMAEEEANQLIAEQNAEVEKLVGALALKARSVKTAKGNIKVTLTVNADDIKAIEDLGYTVKYKFYRSTKKAKGYKAKIEGTGKTYTNTSGKKGTKYYYKARVMVYDSQGTLVAKTALTQCKYACRTR